ncbi:MAG: protein-glutamate O-methyltransferase CheR [SAR324 cluster bacterium]|nr:protein-glutamate O-methyltransferase CheR [SAR324 cluster bacterium]
MTQTSTNAPFESIGISAEEFKLFQQFIYERVGINLSEQKQGLLVTRLNKHIKKLGLRSFRDYYDYLTRDTTGHELSELINQVSTNHTFFFREKAHFDFMTEAVLPQITQTLSSRGELDLRVWCAASSTGEEPYGLGMTLMEFLGDRYSSWSAGLLATDVSSQALETAQNGFYSDDRVASVPAHLKAKYFIRVDETTWQVKPHLRKEITYRRFNLMNKTFPFRKPFHIIFCRNVLIYFDQQTVEELIHRMYTWTAPGGYLFVGHSESLGRINNPYRYIKPSVYRKDGL